MDRQQVINNLQHRKFDDTTFTRIQDDYPVAITCPTCDDTKKYVLRDVEYDCDCQMQKLLQKHYFAANIGREYHDICAYKDFEGPDKDVVLPVIQEYLAKFDDNLHYGIGLSFSGPLGTGKTFAMTSVLKELIQDGRNVYFINFNQMIEIWGSSWHDDKAKKTLQDKLKRAQVLGIDEVTSDKRNLTGFLASGFDAVIRHRTSNLLPTLITTNMSKNTERAEFSKVYSLLSARNIRIDFTGYDRRQSDVRQNIFTLRNASERRPIC